MNKEAYFFSVIQRNGQFIKAVPLQNPRLVILIHPFILLVASPATQIICREKSINLRHARLRNRMENRLLYGSNRWVNGYAATMLARRYKKTDFAENALKKVT